TKRARSRAAANRYLSLADRGGAVARRGHEAYRGDGFGKQAPLCERQRTLSCLGGRSIFLVGAVFAGAGSPAAPGGGIGFTIWATDILCAPRGTSNARTPPVILMPLISSRICASGPRMCYKNRFP